MPGAERVGKKEVLRSRLQEAVAEKASKRTEDVPEAPKPSAEMPPKPSAELPPKPSAEMPPKPPAELPPKPSAELPPKPPAELPPKPSAEMPPKPPAESQGEPADKAATPAALPAASRPRIDSSLEVASDEVSPATAGGAGHKRKAIEEPALMAPPATRCKPAQIATKQTGLLSFFGRK